MSTESTNNLINIVGLNTFLTSLKENTLTNYVKNDDVINQDTIEELIQNSIISNSDNNLLASKQLTIGIYEEVHTTDDKIVEIQSNIMHIWGVMDFLEISFKPGGNKYLFQFDSGETPTVLALPTDIKWANGEFPVIEANYTYQISVLNKCAIIIKFKTV